jgi:hypothetical protein
MKGQYNGWEYDGEIIALSILSLPLSLTYPPSAFIEEKGKE